MKKLIFSACLFLAVSCIAMAQDQLAPATKGQVYGGDTALDDLVMTGSQLEQALNTEEKVNAAIVGEVLDVCEKKGCWMNVKLENGSSYFVKMKDYAFFVPSGIKGKKIMMSGVASREVLSVKELKHYAEDAHKSQEEIDAITQPQEKLRFLANAIRVLE